VVIASDAGKIATPATIMFVRTRHLGGVAVAG
jgi:hypothetical protein